jgi:hypothetical protein
VTLAEKKKGLLIIVTLMSSISRLLVTLAIIDINSIRFLVILLVLHTKAAFTAVNVGFLSIGFLIILIIAEFLSYVKAVLAIIGPRLLDTGLLVVIMAGFLAVDVISVRLGMGFLVMLMALLSAMFLSLVKVTLIGEDTIVYTEPLILLCLNAAVFLN